MRIGVGQSMLILNDALELGGPVADGGELVPGLLQLPGEAVRRDAQGRRAGGDRMIGEDPHDAYPPPGE